VNAWSDGLAAAGVLGVVKHWPGHGQASDTHASDTIVPPWSVPQRRDLIPFKAAFARHADAVIIGHLRVPGLTEGSLPAIEPPTALRTLRAQAGASVLIMTDDLSMAAASKTLGITSAQAAVRSLVAGADVAMVCWAPADGSPLPSHKLSTTAGSPHPGGCLGAKSSPYQDACSNGTLTCTAPR